MSLKTSQHCADAVATAAAAAAAGGGGRGGGGADPTNGCVLDDALCEHAARCILQRVLFEFLISLMFSAIDGSHAAGFGGKTKSERGREKGAKVYIHTRVRVVVGSIGSVVVVWKITRKINKKIN